MNFQVGQRRDTTFRKLVDIKIFHIRRNIMPKNGSHIGYSLFPSVCSDSCFVEILTPRRNSIPLGIEFESVREVFEGSRRSIKQVRLHSF